MIDSNAINNEKAFYHYHYLICKDIFIYFKEMI
jgi:hypothetical protein